MYIAHTRHPAYYNRPATSNEAQDISEFSPAHPHRQSVQAHPRSSLVTPSPSLQLHLCSTLYTVSALAHGEIEYTLY